MDKDRGDVEMVVASGAVLTSAAVLHLGTAWPHAVFLFGHELPDVCPIHQMSGLWCPGCGLTRAFVAMAHGNLPLAFSLNPLGPLLFAVAVLIFLQGASNLIGRPWILPPEFIKAGGWMLCSAFVLLGAYRIGWGLSHIALTRVGDEPPSTGPVAVGIAVLSFCGYFLLSRMRIGGNPKPRLDAG